MEGKKVFSINVEDLKCNLCNRLRMQKTGRDRKEGLIKTNL